MEDNIVRLVNRFVEEEAREGLHVSLILLTYPGFVARIPPGQSFLRRAGTIAVSQLGPFLSSDTSSLTRRALADAGVEDDEVVELWSESLHVASGGIPDLIQAIGWEAYDREKETGVLAKDAVQKVVATPKEIVGSKIAAQLRTLMRGEASFAKEDIPLIAFMSGLPIDGEDGIRVWEMTEDKWKGMLRTETIGTEANIDSFWVKLRKSGVMQKREDPSGPDQYAFLAEAMRINLAKDYT